MINRWIFRWLEQRVQLMVFLDWQLGLGLSWKWEGGFWVNADVLSFHISLYLRRKPHRYEYDVDAESRFSRIYELKLRHYSHTECMQVASAIAEEHAKTWGTDPALPFQLARAIYMRTQRGTQTLGSVKAAWLG